MNSNDKKDLLVEIIRQKIPLNLNELKNKYFYLASENVTVAELAKIFGKQDSQIVGFFWKKGQVINKNQTIPFNYLEDYCKTIGVTIKRKSGVDFREIIEEYLENIINDNQLTERSPVISIMGHIDHGKTTLLDTIRHTNVQKKEIGGITQNISVSQVEFNGKKIIFLDTPGHSDFIKMRQRGISLTDIIVLVIDASDGIMLQTTEIIEYLQYYKIPVIVFINHKKSNENNEVELNRIKTQLQEKNLTPLEWGGETIVISGNSKKIESAKYLLENILLLSDFKTNLQHPANGLVIDSYLHSQTQSRITKLLVRGNKIQEKDNIFINGRFGKIKMLYDLNDNKINSSSSVGDIINVVGIDFPTELGDKFLVINNENTKKSIENQLTNYLEQKSKSTSPSVIKEKKTINLILLADSQNSLEALNDLVRKKDSSNCRFSVIYTAIGNLNNSSINLVKLTQSIILSFGLQINQEQIKTIKSENISFFISKIIYEIEDKLIEIINSQQETEEIEEITGKARVEEIFHFSKIGSIAGCKVISGKINRNNQVHVWREKKKIFTGRIKSLESNKEKKLEVLSGYECGIVLNNFNDFLKGDEIIAFQIIRKNVS